MYPSTQKCVSVTYVYVRLLLLESEFKTICYTVCLQVSHGPICNNLNKSDVHTASVVYYYIEVVEVRMVFQLKRR